MEVGGDPTFQGVSRGVRWGAIHTRCVVDRWVLAKGGDADSLGVARGQHPPCGVTEEAAPPGRRRGACPQFPSTAGAGQEAAPELGVCPLRPQPRSTVGGTCGLPSAEAGLGSTVTPKMFSPGDHRPRPLQPAALLGPQGGSNPVPRAEGSHPVCGPDCNPRGPSPGAAVCAAAGPPGWNAGPRTPPSPGSGRTG